MKKGEGAIIILGIIVVAIVAIIKIAIIIAIPMIIIAIITIPIICIWFIYENIYYRSKKFLEIKNNIKAFTNNCNELNDHIEELKNSYIDIRSVDYGRADYLDYSQYNYKRPELKKLRESAKIYECSRTVCSNARQQPFKYICKYFNIKTDEDTLSNFENVLNDFSAVEEGKVLLENEKERIISSISSEIPFLIRTFSKKKIAEKLGFKSIDFSELYFPKYSFRYVSPGGNSSMSCDVTFDIDNLNRFINYLSELKKFKESIAGQRVLMTTVLREKIKNRDNYRCQCCGLSLKQEPNLLLEIDHIIPLAKGGITREDNLQTLCWRCNRSKGAKIIK